MTTKRWSVLAAVLAALVLVAVPFVYAQGLRLGRHHHGFGGFGMFGRLERAQRALDLSDAQVDEIRSIGAALREQNAPYREQLRGQYVAVAQALLKNPNDTSEAQAMLERQAAAEKTMRQNMLTAASKALNVLTPEQREKASELVSERASRMQR